MAYYVDQDGNKIPVDDHSTQEEKNLAVQQGTSGGPNDIVVGGGGNNVAQMEPTDISQPGDGRTKEAMLDAAEAERQRKAAIAAYNAQFQYGGGPNGANEAAGRYQGLGAAAQSRPGEHINTFESNWDRGEAQGARNEQVGIANLMRARAQGLVPSIAQQQADRQMRQAAAEQSSAAASARGPAGLALAQQGAAANTAAMQSGISNQAQINAATERMQAEQAAMAGYSTIRGGDFQAGGLAAQQAQAQAQINAQQREINDRYQLGMTGFEVGVRNAQLNAGVSKAGIEAGLLTGAANRDMASSQHDDNRTDKYIAMGAGALGTGALIGATLLSGGGKNSAMPGTSGVGDPGAGGNNGNAVPDGSLNPGTSGGEYGGGTYGHDPDPRANGGPVQAGKPYLVGERGPELVVPPYDGHVVTAEETSKILRPATDGNQHGGLLAQGASAQRQHVGDAPQAGLMSVSGLAKKQQDLEAEIARLKSGQGLMAQPQAPSVNAGDEYLRMARGGL